MSKKPTLSPIVTTLLGELRERLNAKYRQRIALGARIDGPSWLHHVEQYIAPVVEVIHAAAPDRSKESLLALYDIGLDLSALGHFNEVGGSLRVIELWRDVFPAIAQVLSTNPRTVIGSLSNAVLYMNQWSSSKTQAWLSMLHRLGPACQCADQLLTLGQFLGWTSGFAHMRQAALKIAAELPVELLRSTLAIPDDTAESKVRDLIRELTTNPWASWNDQPKMPAIAEVGQCGDFRGLDGDFLRPPKTYAFEGEIYITDGHQRWQLHADRFGYTLYRAEAKDTTSSVANNSPSISSDGLLKWGKLTVHRPDLAHSTSHAFDGTTLAVTIPTSYHVFLFARQAP
jgi:hypothetical protein